MIKILPFEKRYQKDVETLMTEISKEFEVPISSPKPQRKRRSCDKLWIATNNESVVGTVGLIQLENKIVELKRMFVNKEFRGTEIGVSQLLLKTVMDWSSENRFSEIYLGTMHQFKAAHKFYEKNGFQRIEKSRLPKDLITNPIDSVFYKKELFDDSIKYRRGKDSDLDSIMKLAFKSWVGFKKELTEENWNSLQKTLDTSQIFIDLLTNTYSVLAETADGEIVGMAFLVSSGNPTDLFEESWSYIRFVSVDPDFGGRGLGKTLTEKLITHAQETNETVIALHTSEMMQKAISIYEKLGFKVLREIPPRLGKRYWIYKLEL